MICAARLTERLMPGVIHCRQASAVYDPLGAPGNSADRGGCVNLLTSKQMQTKKVHSAAYNSCLIEIEKWDGADAIKNAPASEEKLVPAE